MSEIIVPAQVSEFLESAISRASDQGTSKCMPLEERRIIMKDTAGKRLGIFLTLENYELILAALNLVKNPEVYIKAISTNDSFQQDGYKNIQTINEKEIYQGESRRKCLDH